MPDCTVCGGSKFTPHDGYYYCDTCQTQTQDIQQMELAIKQHGSSKAVKSQEKLAKEKIAREPNKDRLGEGPTWTSWQACNYMLKGIVEELVAAGADAELEKVVLRIWVCYLKVHDIAFCSQIRPTLPRLPYPFKYRDGKVLYDLDAASSYLSKSPRKRRRRKSSRSSVSSKSSASTRTLKKKLHQSLYESQTEGNTSQEETNVTLESLGGSSKNSEGKPNIARRMHLSLSAFFRRRKTKGRLTNSCSSASIHLMAKPKLLALINVALIKMKSQIQLSDLLRFIREGHVSYAVMSHMLPAEMHFGRSDAVFINSHQDTVMPTHFSLRNMTHKLALKLRFRSLPAPDLPQLVRRYSTDLLLPDEFADFAVHLLMLSKPRTRHAVTRHCFIPSYDLVAIAPLLVVLKLLLGMDGVTERRTSHFARALNKLQDGPRMFSFVDWQRAIECRSTVLSKYHFPTREMLRPDEAFADDVAAEFLATCHKDPHLRNRLMKTNIPKNERNVELEVEKLVTALMAVSERTALPTNPVFKPSLTPGVSLLTDVVSWLNASGNDDPPWLELLNQDWHLARTRHLTHPQDYSASLETCGIKVMQCTNDWLRKHMTRVNWIKDKLINLPDDQKCEKFQAAVSHDAPFYQKRRSYESQPMEKPVAGVVWIRNDNFYWRLCPPTFSNKYNLKAKQEKEDIRNECSSISVDGTSSSNDESLLVSSGNNRRYPVYLANNWTLDEFNNEILPQFSSSWAWLLIQCSRMLHVPPRDIYHHVIKLEDRLIQRLNIS